MNKCTCHSHNGFLTELGLEHRDQLAQRNPEVLQLGDLTTLMDEIILDSEGSVSGLELERDFCDRLVDEQSRRHHHGW